MELLEYWKGGPSAPKPCFETHLVVKLWGYRRDLIGVSALPNGERQDLLSDQTAPHRYGPTQHRNWADRLG